ncbi:tRNA (adenosine(37)-N6)-threonylcarbamoyltransferase complex dimerization subunit type 1 TsaB [Marinobacter sp. 71-i]|uniref:tRNA threonylcarbamoyladenosine biosynthesis protein TsaB n=1 Tax=Marinobacter iranensis TaxID=2962607 RepID=A0ABT5YE54_9GAMM|nr:tRNA (adenosine(37)-N6)-threonylcarbamoyltransferase complex dimerization subunit type 1 TsaB [Marinobacter iranensis]MDF0751959.1 tRNA (adenosine(37)-N6)-threonylcarbamoyltransferase complex dimerization subunit type 1 TsaB [Marinobacter iranensis]
MKLLALDTSSEGCSAALLVDDSVAERFELAPRGHTRLLMPMIRELLAEQNLVPADLDALAFACGPGSFTGLRIATGVIQGLAYGLDIPVIPVSSLAAVAEDAIAQQNLADGDGLAVAFDARMGEVYWANYVCRGGQPELMGGEQVCTPGSVTLAPGVSRWFGVGQGWSLREGFPKGVTGAMETIDDTLVPRASRVAGIAARAFRAGAGVAAEQAQPVYIRDEVAWKKLPGR